jgi:hypothetical protein
MMPEIMRVLNIRRQHGAAVDFEKFAAASPNQIHPSPPMPNFCGNGFSPWNGMHSEVTAPVILFTQSAWAVKKSFCQKGKLYKI